MVDERAVVVARRAAEVALAAGVDLPDDLDLWALAGGRPAVAPVAGEPEELGRLLEASFDVDARRRQGAHFTPDALASLVVEHALAGHERPTVGDPACGGGALLLAAARHLEGRGEERSAIVGRLWGADIDPVAVATTEVALLLWSGTRPAASQIGRCDALVDELPWPPLDVVVGNPPFLTPLSSFAARTEATTARLRERLGPVVHPYTDAASLFLLRACQLARPGGTVATVQPPSVLAARDATAVRDAVDGLGRLREVVVPAQAGFEAAVEVCVPVIDVGRSGASGRWSAHLATRHGVPAVSLHGTRTLGDEACVTAAFRSEYYGMVDHVAEERDLPAGRPLLTTGLVDLGGSAWGDRPARVGGRRWERPVVDVPGLDGRAAAWVARTGGPKLVVATQTRVVEVLVDDDGTWVAGVPLVVVLAPTDRRWPLAAALAAPAVSAWLLARAAGTARTPQALKVSAALLREVPLPTDDEAWADGTEAFLAGDLERFADAMAVAYGTGADVTAWWLDRARTVWSPRPVPR